MKPNPNYGDLIPVEDFIEAVTVGAFIDYDGHGYWANKEGHETSVEVRPSTVRKMLPPDWATHVLWFNR